MSKNKFSGWWVSKTDEALSVVVDRVYKKGYVTGFSYRKIDRGTVHGQFKATFEELERDYKRN